jgi:hypothetical protein
MPEPRQLKDSDYKYLKAAARRLIKSCGGVEAAAMATRVNKSALSDYQNVDKPDHFMPADVIADLEYDIGQPIMTSAMAKLCSHYMVPDGTRPTELSFPEKLSRIAKETADIFEKGTASMADGVISEQEAEEILREVQDAHDVLQQARGLLEQIIGGDSHEE